MRTKRKIKIKSIASEIIQIRWHFAWFTWLESDRSRCLLARSVERCRFHSHGRYVHLNGSRHSWFELFISLAYVKVSVALFLTLPHTLALFLPRAHSLSHTHSASSSVQATELISMKPTRFAKHMLRRVYKTHKIWIHLYWSRLVIRD